jgi:hypothetical protein
MYNFDKEFQKSERRFNFVWRLAMGIILFVFLMMGLGFIGLIYTGVNAADDVNERGLKAVLEEVWCGKDGC